MKLWLISQIEKRGYDTYDSAVVAAETVDAARKTHPSEYYEWSEERDCWSFVYQDGRRGYDMAYSSGWADKVEQVTAKLLGDAVAGMSPCVICASFNAG